MKAITRWLQREADDSKLRNRMAESAMRELIAKHPPLFGSDDAVQPTYAAVAFGAYAYADAMMIAAAHRAGGPIRDLLTDLADFCGKDESLAATAEAIKAAIETLAARPEPTTTWIVTAKTDDKPEGSTDE